jgi:uncharacterized protein YjbJ (UPF0337 family)
VRRIARLRRRKPEIIPWRSGGDFTIVIPSPPRRLGGQTLNRRIHMKSGTRDQVEGTAKQVKGDIKQAAGKATNRPEKEAEGMIDKAEGTFQKKTGEIKKDFRR